MNRPSENRDNLRWAITPEMLEQANAALLAIIEQGEISDKLTAVRLIMQFTNNRGEPPSLNGDSKATDGRRVVLTRVVAAEILAELRNKPKDSDVAENVDTPLS